MSAARFALRGNLASDAKTIVDAWLEHLETSETVGATERLARDAAEVAWQTISKRLSHPLPLRHAEEITRALEKLISAFGDSFIHRIECEAALSPVFKACLSEIHPGQRFPLPEHLWIRLSIAAGVPDVLMKSHIAKLHANMAP